MKISPLLGILLSSIVILSCQKDGTNYADLTIDGNLFINEETLADTDIIESLSHTRHITGDVIIENTRLKDLSILSNLQEIKGKLDLRYNDELLNLNGLDNLRSIGSLIINYNKRLNDINQIKKVDLRGDLMIYQCEINAIESLDHITELESLTISGIKRLTELNFLPNLKKINGLCRLMDNADLISISLPFLEAVNGDLEFQLNQGLTTIELPSFTTIGGQLVITGNSSLPHLNGLENLQSIRGDILISQNNMLRDINGLGQLRAENDLTIYITKNTSLNEFCGIKRIVGETGRYNINCTIEDNLTNPTAIDILKNCP